MPRTPEKPYDVKPDFGTVLAKHKQLPFSRFMDVIEAKIDDLVDLLNRPVPYDQGPGRVVPMSIAAWFGPLPLTTPVRETNGAPSLAGQDGFCRLAALANPNRFSVPIDGDINVGRDSRFRVKSLNAFGFVNWGYKSNPGFNVPYTNANGVGDILDPVGPNPAIGPNGGAMPLDFFGGTFSTANITQPNLPNISFEVELYDKIRGRRMHDKRLPSQLFSGGRFANRKTAAPLVWPVGSKIEPRLFVTEIRMGSILDGATAFNAASVKAWVCLVFKGEKCLEVPNV